MKKIVVTTCTLGRELALVRTRAGLQQNGTDHDRHATPDGISYI